MNIIFDFDGTIAYSFDYVLQFLVEEAKRKTPLSDEERTTLQGIAMATMARRLRVPVWKLPFLFWKGRRRMGERMSTVQPFPGIKETVSKLYADGHHLYVVSSNSVQNIQTFLENHGMDKYFIKLYSGGFGFFGKAEVIRRVLRHNGLDARETFYIGDEGRDIKAAKRAGIRIVAVDWGYSSHEALERLSQPEPPSP